MFRNRPTAKERLVKECLSTRRYHNCDKTCENNPRKHQQYIDLIDQITKIVVTFDEEDIISFCLHTFKKCNTGFNSYTFNKLLGRAFEIPTNRITSRDQRINLELDNLMLDVLNMLKADPIPELNSLNDRDKDIFTKVIRVERCAMKGALYDTIYKPKGMNSVLSDMSWYNKRYIDNIDGNDSFVLVNPPDEVRYMKDIDDDGNPIFETIDRNIAIKKIARGHRLDIPNSTKNNIVEKFSIEIRMFSWYMKNFSRYMKNSNNIHSALHW